MDDRLGIIYTPRAGAQHSHRRWEKIRQYLEEKKVRYDVLQSEGGGDVGRLVDMLINNNYTTIVIVGGDTALGEAINCLMTKPDDVIDRIKIGTIPNGIGNNFAAFWGIDNDYELAVDYIIRGRTRRVDVGLCTYGAESARKTRYFLNAVNIGIGASILNVSAEAGKLIGLKFFVHVLTMLKIIFEKNRYRIKAVVNYERLEEQMAGMCVGSALGYGQTPNAVPYNGMLDVSVVKGFDSVPQLLHTLRLLVSGKFLNDRSVVRPYRTRDVIIEDVDSAKIAVDSMILDYAGGELSINVLQERVNFIIPSR